MQPTRFYPWAIGTIGVVALAIGATAVGFYAKQFSGPLSTESANWAHFGDYLGGVLGPAFSFLALGAVLFTVFLQARQLADAQDDLRATIVEMRRSTRIAGLGAVVTSFAAELNASRALSRNRSCADAPTARPAEGAIALQ